jgi:hypothetical protein
MNTLMPLSRTIGAFIVLAILNGCDKGKQESSAPTVATLAATKTTPVAAQLNGSVNPNNSSTTISFEFGTTTNYGSIVTVENSPLAAGTSTDIKVNASVSGLLAGEIYHFRIKAENSLGTAYGDDMTFTAGYVLGESIYGGIIFYIDETGQHGLVSSPASENKQAEWGCEETSIPGADDASIGAGYQNTLDIIKGCPTESTAAKICDELTWGGYTDWYLPSKDELHLMYNNLKKKKLGGFADRYYWSSTERDKSLAWEEAFDEGSQGSGFKNGKSLVRAIRAF